MQEISYLPGEGTVIVVGTTVLLLDAPADSEVSTTVWRLVVAGMTHQQIRAVLESYPPASLPDLGVAALSGDGADLLLCGSVRASVTAGSSTTDYHDDSRMWTEFALRPVSGLRLWLRDSDPAARPLPLVGGVVRAGAVHATLAGPASRAGDVRGTTASESAVAVEPTRTTSRPVGVPVAAPPPPMEGVFVERVRTSGPVAVDALPSLADVWVDSGKPTPPAPVTQAAPDRTWPPPPAPAPAATAPPAPEAPAVGWRTGPAVWAARCPYGHLNAPDGQFCRICGTQIVERDLSFVNRPPLGRLDFGPLGWVPLDGDLLIGRDPGEQPPDGPRPVMIDHANLSGRHIGLQVRGWTVIIVDLGSEHGTTLVLPGRAAKPLRAHSPEPIVEGTVVWLAQQVHCTYVAAQF